MSLCYHRDFQQQLSPSMSNPNMQKIGKRKNPPGQKQPDWLFPDAGKPEAVSAPKVQDGVKKDKKDKQLAKDLLKRRAAGEPPKSAPPSQLLELVGAFLTEYEFTGASQALRSERESRGENPGKVEGIPSLSTVFNEWSSLKGDKLDERVEEKVVGKKHKAKKQESSSSESSSSSDEDSDVEMADAPPTKKITKRSSSPSSSSSSSSSDSDADDEKEVPAAKAVSPKSKINNLKRKAESSSDSSSSGSDSSSEDDAPKTKKAKTVASSSSDSSSSDSSDSSSDSDSSSEDEVKKAKATDKKTKKTSDSESSSSADSSSSSDSESDSDSSTNSLAQKTPLPDSDSDSSDSGSDSSSSGSSAKNANKKPVAGSDTSATLSDGPKKLSPSSSDSSSDSSSSESEAETKVAKVAKTVTTTTAHVLDPPLPPEPVLKKKKVNEPFSRIPKDIKVDERLASNAYVPYDYAQKAHEDLIITRGKGFTKEKNKKKRGSYKGGYIDVDGKKGIKFED